MTKIMKKNKKNHRKKIRLVAAAVLSVTLLSAQMTPAAVKNTETVSQQNNVIPENITIETAVPLSEVKLPENEYGKLTWADGSQVPTVRSEKFEVIFHPADNFDLSYFKDWDGKSEVYHTYITVVVSSLTENVSEETNKSGEQEIPEEETVSEEPAEEQPEEAVSDPAAEEGNGTENTEQKIPDSQEASAEGEQIQEEQTTPVTETPENTEANEEVPSESENAQEPISAPGESPADEQIPEETPSVPAGPSESEEASQAPETTPEPEENIFDKIDEPVIDERPTVAEENLTAEEQRIRASENHSCDGITVSGINLPWYVQFRATSGESYEFACASQASIFRSYEFELWDLRTGMEYEIPDGEYVSVTIPVKEGYEYTVEHLLDNGATETIIPSVEGTTMIFSTHSFSPFGIAGSKTIIGGEIPEANYTTPTPSPVPTTAPTSAPQPVPTKAPQATPTAAPQVTPVKEPTKTPVNTVTDKNGQNTFSGSSQNVSSGSSTQQTVGDSEQTESRAVATGDNTRILPFVILVAAAVLVIIAALILLKKKK